MFNFEYTLRPDLSPSKPNNVVLECDQEHFDAVKAYLDKPVDVSALESAHAAIDAIAAPPEPEPAEPVAEEPKAGE